jgi:A/G-specific adenine glycosylase
MNMALPSLAQRLLDWYAASARVLPWRGSRDPYAVWVSEIMLQQTRVDTVIPYYQRWMELFPSVETLAKADQAQVLHAWEGLGYYSRARNLHRAAQRVLEEFGGQLPKDLSLLRKLPGVGAYTVGAIASIAFGMDEPAVDGNIRRVLARVFDVDLPESSPQGKRRFDELARENLPPGCAGDYNQALMDLGATICIPRNPLCLVCPLAAICQAQASGLQEKRPVSLPRPQVPHYIVAAAVIRRGSKVLITQRPAEGLLGSLWEFPGGKQEPGESLVQTLEREITEELGVKIEIGEPFGVYRHAYTHFKITLHAFLCRLNVGEPQTIQVQDLKWVGVGELGNFGMGKVDRQIAIRCQQENFG